MSGVQFMTMGACRRPARVLRATFAILTFDQTGCLDAVLFSRQQIVQVRSAAPALNELGERAREQPDIWDAPFPFEDRGGRWIPTRCQLRGIQYAALGKKPVSRLRENSAVAC